MCCLGNKIRYLKFRKAKSVGWKEHTSEIKFVESHLWLFGTSCCLVGCFLAMFLFGCFEATMTSTHDLWIAGVFSCFFFRVGEDDSHVRTFFIEGKDEAWKGSVQTIQKAAKSNIQDFPRWWLQICFWFSPLPCLWKMNQFWLIFFKDGCWKTTNQFRISRWFVACWAVEPIKEPRFWVEHPTFCCVIFLRNKENHLKHLFEKLTVTFWHGFLGGPQLPRFFFLIFRQCYLCSESFWSKRTLEFDLLRSLSWSRQKGFQTISRTVWSWPGIEVVSHQWQCHLQFDTSMVDEYDSNTAGGTDCRHFECHSLVEGWGGFGVGGPLLLVWPRWVGWDSKFCEAIFLRQKKRRLLEVLTVAMLEVFFWSVLCNGMLRIFRQKTCSKMAVKISQLFFFKCSFPYRRKSVNSSAFIKWISAVGGFLFPPCNVPKSLGAAFDIRMAQLTLKQYEELPAFGGVCRSWLLSWPWSWDPISPSRSYMA